MKVTISKEFEQRLESAVKEKLLSMDSIPAAEEIAKKIAKDLTDELKNSTAVEGGPSLPFHLDVRVDKVKKSKKKNGKINYICNIVWGSAFRESVAAGAPGKPKYGVSLVQIYNNGVDIPEDIRLPYHPKYGKVTSHKPTDRHKAFEGFIQDACSKILDKYGSCVNIKIRSFYDKDISEDTPYYDQTTGAVNPSRMVNFKG